MPSKKQHKGLRNSLWIVYSVNPIVRPGYVSTDVATQMNAPPLSSHRGNHFLVRVCPYLQLTTPLAVSKVPPRNKEHKEMLLYLFCKAG